MELKKRQLLSLISGKNDGNTHLDSISDKKGYTVLLQKNN